MRYVLILIALLFAVPLWAGALVGEDPQEARVREIATQLRCPVCQSENILDSHSGTAREMLDLVREQAAKGRSNAEIVTFFQTRYGDYVLLSPPASGPGFVIWWIPVLLVIGGAGLGLMLIRRMKRRAPEATPQYDPLSIHELEEMEP